MKTALSAYMRIKIYSCKVVCVPATTFERPVLIVCAPHHLAHHGISFERPVVARVTFKRENFEALRIRELEMPHLHLDQRSKSVALLPESRT